MNKNFVLLKPEERIVFLLEDKADPTTLWKVTDKVDENFNFISTNGLYKFIYTCNCSSIFRFKYPDLVKHYHKKGTNLSTNDDKAINLFLKENNSFKKSSFYLFDNKYSFLDFYCSKCNKPIKIVYVAITESGMGGNVYAIIGIIEEFTEKVLKQDKRVREENF